jgi:two-component system, NarL family, nitrate/nitrite sensor histidine kinase NarX
MRNAYLSLMIDDNGKGFLCSTSNGEDHYGLKNMKLRAEQINASFTVETKPGEGTSIAIVVPLTS